MNKVSKHPEILRHWKTFARTLDLSDADIIQIEHANRDNILETSYQVLVKWKAKHGKKATSQSLKQALIENECNTLAC